MKQHHIIGGGGLKLRAKEAGRQDRPSILFLHGFSQAAQCWHRQLSGSLAQHFRLVALDLRGHGFSEKPLDAANYTDSKLWADDVDATIDQLHLGKTIVVGWSYSGFLVCDLLRHHGSGKLAGAVFCSAVTKVGAPDAMALIGPGMMSHVPNFFSTDSVTATQTLGQFVRDCHTSSLSDEEYYLALGYNCAVPPSVRLGLFSRQLDNDDVLAKLDLPSLVIHGGADTVVLPSSSRHTASLVPGARLVTVEGAGHAVFADAPQAFDAALLSFAQGTSPH